MAKSLCEREKMLKHDFEAYAELVREPRFVCTHCGRAAHKKKHLCHPKKMPPVGK
ncbi:MAG: hypothetical protein ACE5EY_10000 [Anaerolineae bacterium]